jgi:hypothetical protein
MRTPVGLTFFGAAFGAAVAVAFAQLAASDALSTAGVGPVKLGMTLAEARAAYVDLISTESDSGPGCYFARAASVPGLTFMLRDGKIIRVDVAAPADLKTVDGFKRGDDGAAVKAFYAAKKGGVSDVPLASATGATLLAAPAFGNNDDAPRLAYEVDTQGKVVALHAGLVAKHLTVCPE